MLLILKNWRTGTKVYAVVGVCLLSLIAIVGLAVVQLQQIGTEIEGIAEQDLPLTAGHTEVSVRVHAQDEIGMVATSLETFRGKLIENQEMQK